MSKLFTKINSIASNDRGATAVEYALLVGLIAVAVIVGVTALGGQIADIFNDVRVALGGTP